jgi:ABC-type multidrug transport system, permease component
MTRAVTVGLRVVRQVWNDKRTLALILFAPIAVISLLWVVVNSQATKPTLAVAGGNDEYIAALKSRADLLQVADAASAEDLVRDKRADAAVDLSGLSPKILLDGADPSISALTLKAVSGAGQEVLQTLDIPLVKKMTERMKPSVVFLHGTSDATAFDYLAPVMMGFVIFFFIFILSGIAFLSERLSGTLERSLTSGATRGDVVVGYIIGYGIFALLQTIFFQSFMIYVLGIRSEGSFFATFLINFSLALSALSLGSLVSAFARNEFQVFQFIPLVVIPQVLFSGILDLRASPAWVQVVSKCFPLTYAGDALRNVMLRGQSLGSVGFDLGMVFGFSALFIALNVLVLRRSE